MGASASPDPNPNPPASPVADERLELGEGGRWVDGRLVLVDIPTGRLLEPSGGALRELAHLDVPLGAVAPIAGGGARWLAAAGHGFAVLEPDGGVAWLARPEAGRPGAMRMNDGVAHPGGAFFAGSMDEDEATGAGRLYRLDPDGTVTVVLDGITVPNGPAFSDDGRIAYFADTAEGVIWRMDVDPRSAELGPRHELIRLADDDGAPDGMLVDRDGRLWVALWGAGRVACLAPDGTRELTLELPCRQPTSVCLEPDGPGRLWVTSATQGLSAPGPLDGALVSLPVAATARTADEARIAPVGS